MRRVWPLAVCAFWMVGGIALAPTWGAEAKAPASSNAHTQDELLLATSDRALHHLQAAHQALHVYRLPVAQAHLDTLAAQADGYWAAHHGRALVALFQAFMTEETAYFEQVEMHADALRDALGQAPANNPWTLHMEGEADLMRALVAGREERTIRAALRARSAFRTLRRVTERHPEFAESHLGTGLVRYTIGVLPNRYRRVLRVIGFEGDAEQGLRDLERAAEESTLNASFAQAAHGLMRSVVEGDTDAAVARIAPIYAQYRESPLWAYVYGFALIENREATQAQDVLRRGSEQVAAGATPVSFLHFFRGRVAFAFESYEEAIGHLRTYIQQHAGEALMPTAHLYLGLATEMAHGWTLAQPYYRQVSGARDFEEDAVMQRWAERHLNAAMTSTERTLLQARNAYDSGRYALAIDRLTPLLDASLSRHDRAEAHYRLGRVYQAQAVYHEALHHYALAQTHTDRASDVRWGAWAWYHTATIYRSQGQTAAARTAYETALDWPTPYDYHEGLHQAARVALERMET